MSLPETDPNFIILFAVVATIAAVVAVITFPPDGPAAAAPYVVRLFVVDAGNVYNAGLASTAAPPPFPPPLQAGMSIAPPPPSHLSFLPRPLPLALPTPRAPPEPPIYPHTMLPVVAL